MSLAVATEHTIDWGLTNYRDALESQLSLLQQRIRDEIEDTLILTEHYPVYTLGARIGAEKNLHLTPTQLEAKGIALHKINRGGDITYHGPGQQVGYAIVKLTHRDLHEHLRKLEQVLINTFATYDLPTQRREGFTGIWIEQRKIAAIGVSSKQWVTYHGFAANINNDLTPFEYIQPCGIALQDGTVTSLAQELKEEIDIETFKDRLAVEFWKIFTQG